MVDSVQVRVKKSLHHVEVNLSETNGYEKHVIVDLFKETYGQVIDNSQPCCPENCKGKWRKRCGCELGNNMFFLLINVSVCGLFESNRFVRGGKAVDRIVVVH